MNMKPTLKPCRCCNGTGMEKAFQSSKPKLTYRNAVAYEFCYAPLGRVEIMRTSTGGYFPILNGQQLPGTPIYASSDAAKLAVERQLLESARTLVEILG